MKLSSMARRPTTIEPCPACRSRLLIPVVDAAGKRVIAINCARGESVDDVPQGKLYACVRCGTRFAVTPAEVVILGSAIGEPSVAQKRMPQEDEKPPSPRYPVVDEALRAVLNAEEP